MRLRAAALAIGVAVGLVGSLGVATGAVAGGVYGNNADGWDIGITNESTFDFLYLEDDSWNVREASRGISAGSEDDTVRGVYSQSYFDYSGENRTPDDLTLSYDSLELAAGWVRFIDVVSDGRSTATVTCGVRNDDITHLGGCSVENRVSDDQPNTVRADEPVLVTFTSLGDEGQWLRRESVPAASTRSQYYAWGIHNDGWRVRSTNKTSADLFSAGGKRVSQAPQGVARGSSETTLGTEYRSMGGWDGGVPHNVRFDFESLDLKPGWKRFVAVESDGGDWSEWNRPPTQLSCGISSPDGKLYAHGCEGLKLDWEKPITVTFTDPGAGPWSP